MSKKTPANQIALNRKARHYYQLFDFYEAGIILTGSEVKSIRAGSINFRDAYVTIRREEAFLIGLHIAPYTNAGYAQHDPDRERKLLLHNREITILSEKIDQKGLTIIPINMHFRNGKVKVEIALGKGKKLYDQRQDLKNVAIMKETAREIARY